MADRVYRHKIRWLGRVHTFETTHRNAALARIEFFLTWLSSWTDERGDFL